MTKILVCILLQFVFFIPFYMLYRKDCKTIGKYNLAVSLEERFLAWICLCPIWICGILD
jgi:hypothetical protein